MRLLLARSENITLTIIIIPLTLSPLCLQLLVRLGGYIVNLCAFYFYKLYIVNLCAFYFCKLIGKLTASLQLKGFNLHTITVPLPPFGVLLTAQVKDWAHSH